MAEPEKIPVWLDCDPGHDDAFAMLLLATHPFINPLGVSTTHGNSSVSHTTLNATRLLTSFGPSALQIPVYQGMAHGLTRPAVHAPAIHGESGLDGTDLLPSPLTSVITDPSGVDAMAQALLTTPRHTAWVIATGALTNVALVFMRYPDLADHIKGLSIMGGAVGDNFTNAQLGSVNGVPRIGNWSIHAEFNILIDPEAAREVFSDPILRNKTTLIPLDVSHLVLATPSVQNMLLKGKNGQSETVMRKMLVELLIFFADTYAEVFGINEGPPLHDPIALAVLLDEIEGLEFDYRGGERFEVSIVTEGTHEDAQNGAETGKTVVKLLPPGDEGVRIPRGLNVPRFWALIEESLTRADQDNAVDRPAVTVTPKR